MIGIFGGTFDPVHLGHLRLIEEIHQQLCLTTVHWIPTANPPHRQMPQASTTQRCNMLELAIAGHEGWIADFREVSRAGASYTIDSLQELRQFYGSTMPLCLILGGDAFSGLAGWRRWTELPDMAHIVIAQRPQTVMSAHNLPSALYAMWQQRQITDPALLRTSAAGHILTCRTTALDISASAIRQSRALAHSVRYLVPEPVLHYLTTHQLYRQESHGT